MGLWETETCRVKIKEINTQNKQLHPLVTLLQYWPWLISNLTHKILIYLHIIHLLKSSHETCQWLKFPPNVLRAQSRVSPVVGLLPSASGPAYLGMAFPPFLMKQLYRSDSVVNSCLFWQNIKFPGRKIIELLNSSIHRSLHTLLIAIQ